MPKRFGPVLSRRKRTPFADEGAIFSSGAFPVQGHERTNFPEMSKVRVARTLLSLQSFVAEARKREERIALVPTMGNLHQGHLRLVEEARKDGSRVIVTLFVNPGQFGPKEDYERYPRTPESDLSALDLAGADLVFMPQLDEVYPRGVEAMTRVEVPYLSDRLCGISRPGHFRGVTTVVLKLFNMARPDSAFFGEKDFQQLLLIRYMTRDLDLPIEIHGVPTVREPDGLALSSRNAYLDRAERQRAPGLYRALSWVRARVLEGERDYDLLASKAEACLLSEGFRVDYLTILQSDDLEAPAAGGSLTGLRIFSAVWLGTTRLIDNLSLDPEKA